MRAYVAIIALFTLAVVAWPEARKPPEIVAFPDLSPHMEFRVVQGTVKKGQKLEHCSLGRMDNVFADHTDIVGVLTCPGDIRLEWDGAYFDDTVDLVVETEK